MRVNLAKAYVTVVLAFSVALPLGFALSFIGLPSPVGVDKAFAYAPLSILLSLIALKVNSRAGLNNLGFSPRLFRLLLSGGFIMIAVAILAWLGLYLQGGA